MFEPIVKNRISAIWKDKLDNTVILILAVDFEWQYWKKYVLLLFHLASLNARTLLGSRHQRSLPCGNNFNLALYFLYFTGPANGFVFIVSAYDWAC